MAKYFFTLALLFGTPIVYAQSSELVRTISSLQISRDTFYTRGLFPSQITWKKGKRSAEDNNIFFTAITLYTLQSIRQHLSPADNQIVDSIFHNAKSAFPLYKSRTGDITYNFYQVRPDNAFPNVKFLKRFNAKLPDDLDDTSMLYLTEATDDSLNKALKQKMVDEVYEKRKVNSTLKSYRHIRAYRTWFADKMNQDIDICVNTNILTFVFEKHLTLDTIDYAAIDFIKQVVQKNEHRTHGHLVSPHYQNTSIILYHIARLIAAANHEMLNSVREKVINDLKTQLLLSKNNMEKVILLSSLTRLGQNVSYDIPISSLKNDMEQFYWFRANLASGQSFKIKRILGRSNFLLYAYKSEAFYWSLTLELQKISGGHFEAHNNRFYSKP